LKYKIFRIFSSKANLPLISGGIAIPELAMLHKWKTKNLLVPEFQQLVLSSQRLTKTKRYLKWICPYSGILNYPLLKILNQKRSLIPNKKGAASFFNLIVA
jgi:hypothetical protein